MRALIIGRYQPFHNGHLEVIKEILEENDFLTVCIGSAQHSHSLENPYTAGERLQMILNTLNSNNLKNFCVVPVMDINRYALWVAHVESMVPPFDRVYSHNPLTRRLFAERGYEVLESEIYEREYYSGEEIRRRIINNESWHDLVPNEVVRVIEDVHGVDRLRELAVSPEAFKQTEDNTK